MTCHMKTINKCLAHIRLDLKPYQPLTTRQYMGLKCERLQSPTDVW